MKWSNIRLIVAREIRDQLRDRRTIFVIAILPLMLYPLLGLTFLQVTQFLKEHPTRIWIVGADRLPADPPLMQGDAFEGELLGRPDAHRLFEIQVDSEVPPNVQSLAKQAVKQGEFDAVVIFSQRFARQMHSVLSGNQASPTQLAEEVGPQIIFNQARDKSRVARDRVVGILRRWRARIVRQTLSENEVPARASEPFQLVSQDLSGDRGRRAAFWSKILPFVIIIWAMTGAFYPAVDLCAGEKERGTLETLLSSPASRFEIVWGKLLTVIVFSMATSLLNLASLGLTGRFIAAQLQSLSNSMQGFQLGPPPWTTLAWLVVALVPIAALFSALSLALAAMARSSKEGQYYLMPLMLGTMPLMLLPMLPAVELDLGNSLIPITGMILVLRNLIEGEHILALRFALPVALVTTFCCWLAVRWALHQFQDERILFHESERFTLKSWLIHLVRDRGVMPTVAQAFGCGVLLLLARFFTVFLPPPTDWNSFATQTLLLQIVLIAAPAVGLALLLTRDPVKTLLIRWPSLKQLALVALLAVALHPVATALAAGIHELYPISEQTLSQLKPLQATMGQAPSLWHILALMALLPALCEELAFRGFILSGLRRLNHPALPILVSSLFFAIAHPVLQQSLLAFALGLVIGFVALRTGSMLACIAFHLIHNTLQLSAATWAIDGPPWLTAWAEVRDPGLVVYHWPVVVCAAAISTALLLGLRKQDTQDIATRGVLETPGSVAQCWENA